MDFSAFLDSWFFAWVLMPLLIFLARIVDVSLGTLRLIFAAKGLKKIAPILGFIESFIWLIAIGQIIRNIDNWASYLAFAGGFSMGSYVGIVLDEKLSIGNVMIRVIPRKDTTELISHLREINYGVTSVEVDGREGRTRMLLSIIRRKDIKEYIQTVNRFNPKAFYTIEEVRIIKDGYIKGLHKRKPFHVFNPFRSKRK